MSHLKQFTLRVSLMASIVLLGSFITTEAQTQQDIIGPTGSGLFGSSVVLLTNGNFVVSDPDFDDGPADIGAVYLYSGQTGQLIVRMVGSTADDRIGSGGVFALPNGNYVVSSPNYDGAFADAGAVSFCNGSSGCSQVGSLGSMFGNTVGVRIGGTSLSLGSGAFKGITVLTNGNFVVVSPEWRQSAPGEPGGIGAVTFCSGTSGCPATVATINSLIGVENADAVGTTGGGLAIKNGVAPLTNGNYVVNSANFDAGSFFQNAGASTFCNGTSGCVGVVSSSNSLVGTRGSDRVGEGFGGEPGVVDLKNGNYVVQSSEWSTGMPTISRVGAVSFCPSSGCVGPVSVTNSLIGSTANDNVGAHTTGSSITVLPNGGYVVSSPTWDSGGIANVGAATFCGLSGCAGTITASNSLIGNAAEDRVGSGIFGGAIALANGNYVVVSEQWNGPSSSVGAVTFCSGIVGCSNLVSASNSLIGSVSLDSVGNRGVTALPNGNYVVISSLWDNSGIANVGAATYCSGTSGCIGPIQLSNSLVGVKLGDGVGSSGVVALANGNYVVGSSGWDNGTTANVGASTWCSGATGCAGTVSPSNSLVGSTANDMISSSRALTNGNYVVLSQGWDNGTAITDAGAVTWCSGTSGCIGTVTTSNALIGSTTNDRISFGGGVTALPGGNYVVGSGLWDDAGLADAGALTFGKGDGSTTGPITAVNSVRGATTHPANLGGSLAMTFVFDPINQQLVVGRRLDKIVTIFRPGIARRTPFDFDGDGRSDTAVFRPSDRVWYLNRSTLGFAALQWGLSTDTIAPADYDGDGKTDIAVWRDEPSDPDKAVFYVMQSSNNAVRIEQFGRTGDVPSVVGDWDGDGKADPAVYRAGIGGGQSFFFYRPSSQPAVDFTTIHWGVGGDTPMHGDFDGDGKLDAAVFRPSENLWYIRQSSNGQPRYEKWGVASDKFVPADYDGDGKTDLAVFRNGTWYITQSSNNQSVYQNFGLTTDQLVPADYDGDGRADIALFRDGIWHVLQSQSGSVQYTRFGASGDKAVPSAYQQ